MIFPVLSYAYGDVNGDRVPDNVFLIGESSKDSPYIINITLVIQDGKSGGITSVPLKVNRGYNPMVTLRDFNGDGINDIFISMSSGGSGGTMYYYIYSFLKNRPKMLFDYNEYNTLFQYTVDYQDLYKVLVTSKINNKKYIIDLSYRDNDYLNEVYNKEGILKKPISGFVNPISGLYPIDFNYDNVYELLAYQKIAGLYNADSLGYVENILKWDGKSFSLDNQYVAIF